MSEAIARALAEATTLALQTMAEAWPERMHNGSGPKLGGPTMKKPTFDWDAQDKYSELKTFRLDVNNIFSTYNAPQMDKLALVKNWLGRKGLQYLEMLTMDEKETSSMLEGLFETLCNKLKTQYKTIKSLQFRKLYRYENEMWDGKAVCGSSCM